MSLFDYDKLSVCVNDANGNEREIYFNSWGQFDECDGYVDLDEVIYDEIEIDHESGDYQKITLQNLESILGVDGFKKFQDKSEQKIEEEIVEEFGPFKKAEHRECRY